MVTPLSGSTILMIEPAVGKPWLLPWTSSGVPEGKTEISVKVSVLP